MSTPFYRLAMCAHCSIREILIDNFVSQGHSQLALLFISIYDCEKVLAQNHQRIAVKLYQTLRISLELFEFEGRFVTKKFKLMHPD